MSQSHHNGGRTPGQQRVLARIEACLSAARERWPEATIPTPRVRFDLRGRAAGQAHRSGSYVRINNDLLERYADRIVERTTAHEIAHVVAHAVFGERIRPHGREWKSVMRLFGCEPSRCHDMETTPARKVRTFPVTCACSTYRFSTVRIKRLRAGTSYRCPRCRQHIKEQGG